MKKLMGVIIAFCLVFAAVIPASAAPGDSALLEKAIQKVKTIVDIPASLTEFEYDSWEDPEFGVVWNLNWRDAKYESSINVSVSEDGTIFNYSYYSNEEKTGMGNLSREEGQKKAEAFLAKVLPAETKNLKLFSTNSYGSSLTYQFDLYKNNIPVKYTTVTVDVDKHTGNVSNYYGYNVVTSSMDIYPSVTNPIGEEKAKDALLENGGISLIYISHYDWQKKELKVFPGYSLIAPKQYVDAASGKIVKEYDSYPVVYASDAGGSAEQAAEKESNLTPGEQQAVDNVAGLFSKEEAIKVALSKIPKKPADTKLSYANLSKSYEEQDKFIWHFSYEDCSVSINAKTGELISYNSYPGDQKSSRSVSQETAEKTAQAFLKSAAGDKLAQIAYSEDRSRTEFPVRVDRKVIYEGDSYSFVYTRMVNGVEFPGNGVSISVDLSTGKISQYTLSWYDSITFPFVEDVMGAEKAFQVMAEEGDFELIYIKAEEKKAAMVYGFRTTPSYYIDPFTGTKIGDDGKPYKRNANVQEYDDIDGKWYADTVKKLLDSGYYIEGESFLGSKLISQEEFFRYLYAPDQSWYDQERFYEMLIQMKVIKKEEKAPESIISRQEAAKFSIRYLGLDKAAKDGSIFKVVYQDAVSEEYAGYAALVKAFGIMQGDAKGNFNGAKEMTRAEAAMVIYYTLENK